MTHQDYFKKYRVSIEQYGVLLVSLAFRGRNTPHGNKGFDVGNATINGKSNCRIEVKSKVADGASVIHCNENKFISGGMTHLAVVLVDNDFKVTEAWLITSDEAKRLRTKTRSKYIPVKKLRNFSFSKKRDIKNKLNRIAKQSIKSDNK